MATPAPIIRRPLANKVLHDEARARFLHDSRIDVPFGGNPLLVVSVEKDTTNGFVNLSGIIAVLLTAKQRTPRHIRSQLQAMFPETFNSLIEERRTPSRGTSVVNLWVEPVSALALLGRFGVIVDTNLWAVRRAFCAASDFWYIQRNPRALRAASPLTQKGGYDYIEAQHKMLNAATTVKDTKDYRAIAAKKLWQLAAAIQRMNPPLTVDKMTPQFVVQCATEFAQSGAFPDPTTATAAAASSSSSSAVAPMDTDEVKSLHRVSWKVPDLETARRSYQVPNAERLSALYVTVFGKSTEAPNVNDPVLLSEFEKTHGCELYDVVDQHSIYSSMDACKKRAVAIVSALQLLFTVFRDRFAFLTYRNSVAGTSGQAQISIPSGVIGKCTPAVPLPVLLKVLEAFIVDNPELECLKSIADFRLPFAALGQESTLFEHVAFLLTYSVDSEHAQVTCPTSTTTTIEMTSKGKPRHRRKHDVLTWPRHIVDGHVPRAFLHSDVVLNVDIRTEFVPWPFVEMFFDTYENWSIKHLKLPVGPTRSKPMQRRRKQAHSDDESNPRDELLKILELDYNARRCWSFAPSPLVPNQAIGVVYVPLVRPLLTLLETLNVLIKPVDASDCSVYMPLHVFLRTLSDIHPAIHVLLRFLTADQMLRLITSLRLIDRPELRYQTYPRYGFLESADDRRNDLFIQNHDVLLPRRS